MPAPNRRTALALIGAALLCACAPSEADQRKAFIAFLQDDVLARPGLRLPRPDADKLKSFGDYAAHYAVITRFHERMDASVAAPMQKALSGTLPRSIEEAVKRKAEIAQMRQGLAGLREALDAALAAAETERAALKQPPDLAPVYAQAYAKLVTAPAETFRQVFPPTDDGLGAILSLADLLDANKAKIKITGSQMEIADAALRNKVQAALAAMRAKQDAMNAAQQAFRATLYGS